MKKLCSYLLILVAFAAAGMPAHAQDHQITLIMPQHWLSSTTTSGGQVSVQVTDANGQSVSEGTLLVASANPAALSVTPNQVQLSGQGGTFSVTRHHDQVDTCTDVTITVSFQQASEGEAVQVCPASQSGVTALSVTPGEVDGGEIATGTISYQQGNTFGLGGTPVSVTSSDLSVASVPTTVNVQSSTATFEITTYPVTSPHTVTITARKANASNTAGKTATLVVNPLAPVLRSLALNPQEVVGGATVQGTVHVDHVTPENAPVLVNFQSNLPELVFSPAQISVTSSAPVTFSVETPLVGTTTAGVVKASSSAGDGKARLQLIPLGFQSLTLAAMSVEAGGSTVATLRLSSPAPQQLQVQLTSTQPNLVGMPQTLTFASGELEKTFKVRASTRLRQAVTVTLKATLGLSQGQEATAEAQLQIQP